jgi:hypothetical protein
MRTRAGFTATQPTKPCFHIARICPVVPGGERCSECMTDGNTWGSLRLCLTCGWVACSNNSSGYHAQAHYAHTDHPIASPLTGPPGVRWCFVHQRYV